MADRGRSSSLEQEGRALVERLGGRWSGGGGVCRCPAHDDRTPSLSVRPGQSRLLLHCFAGCAAEDVLRELQAQGLMQASSAEPFALNREPRRFELSAAALRIWDEARPIRQTPAQAYLESRGLRSDSPQLRYHARTPHGPRPATRYRPALIAAVRDDGGLVGIHRTFLDWSAAEVSAARCRSGLGRFGRGAVRLGDAAPRLGLAEGIETALSATALFGIPCWATLGTERFGLVYFPPHIEELVLFLDHDPGGRRAEKLARKAFMHSVKIEARYPDRPGDDWNDVLRRCGGPDFTAVAC